MAKPVRAIALTVALVIVTLSVLVYFAPLASAASKVWTTDTDFNAPGAIFNSVEVIGTGVAAEVDLIRSTTDWANRNPPAPIPGGLTGPSMTFDAAAGVAVLFGGYDGTAPDTYSDRTWEYDWSANTWTEITTTPKPPSRQGAGLSYDPGQGVVVLWGGYNDGGFHTDTWEYNVASNTWSETTPGTSPPQMADTPLVYFASQSQHVTFGQCISGPCSGNMVTWAYDAATNTWSDRAPSGTPSGRSGFGFAYHAFRDRAVAYGGAFFTTLYDQTFEYRWSPSQWSQTASGNPPARAGHTMTYRPTDTSVLLFGGSTASGVQSQTWRYDSNGAWSIVTTPTSPPARQYAGFTYDTANDVAVLYGGEDGTGTRLSDTWSLGSAYANAGSYTPAPFDSGGFANWDNIWWNDTASPPLMLRFLLAFSNDGVTWTGFHGHSPSCSVSVYYTTPGTSIACPGDDGKRYIKFLAQFGTTDTQQTPRMKDVTINYTIPPAPPCIVSTDPPSVPDPGAFGVPTWKNITVQFSEAINPATFAWRLIRGALDPSNFTAIWSPDNTVVTLYHMPPQHSPGWLLGEAQVYQFQFYGRDSDNLALSATCPDGSASKPGYSAANPLTFTTQAINPTILQTTPPLDARNVNWTSNVVVRFSEGMNTSSAVVTFLDGPPVTFAQAWSSGDTILTLSHSTPFTKCERYELLVNATDKANLGLVPGPVPNPWFFYIECDNPYITAQSPFHYQLDVAVTAPVVIDFVEPMLTSSVVVTIRTWPGGVDIGGQTRTWTMSNTRLTITHSQAFAVCGVYEVTVSGTDPLGFPLIQNPVNPAIVNPWKFQASCPNPIILFTTPEDQATDVRVVEPVVIMFNEQMVEGSAVVTVTGGSWREVGRTWAASTRLTIDHMGFDQCARYTIQVTATSQAGFSLVPGFVPNPWSFDIICNAPYIVTQNPAADQVLVGLGTEIWVNFSKAMDPPTVVWLVNNPVPTFTSQWLNGDTTLRLTHAVPLVDCFTYNITIDGYSADGFSMIVGPNAPGLPNPWEFTTRCAGFYIIRTDPANLQQNVPWDKSIVVEFSEPVDRATFQFSLAPPGGITFTSTWSGGDTVVTLSHGTPFPECVLHTATVSARNLGGQPLTNVSGSAANPWQFRTLCVPPQITSTDPFDGETNVLTTRPIIINFSEPMLRSSVSVTGTPALVGATFTWSNGDRMLTVNHLPFVELTLYTILVQGRDLDNNPLVPGPVPNPWTFTTGLGATAPRGLQVIRMFPNDILLDWQDVPGAISYVVYHSISKTAPWPWSSLAEVTTSAYVHAGALDALSHFYIVRAKFGPTQEGGNSTMGFKVPLSFSFSTSRSNVYWLSLPYRTMYRRASDISTELGPADSKISVIGKWDAATQRTILWYYFRGAWRGTDFPINAGDGIYVSAHGNFQWQVNGTDGSVPRTFTLYPPPSANINWISLPYTATYTRASHVVIAIEGGLGATANTKIIEVAKWDGVTQTLVRFYWTVGGWTGGTDFTIAPGEGVYLKVVSTFTWTPALITPEVS